MRSSSFGVFLFVLIAACSDNGADGPVAPSHPTLAETSATLATGPDAVPERSMDYGAHWAKLTEQQLFEHVAQHDSVVILGLKEPGQRRGVWRNARLVHDADVSVAREFVERMPGVVFLDTIVGLPAIMLQVHSPEAVARLRLLPWTDYLEPNYIRGNYLSDSSGSGCDYHTFTPSPVFQGPTGDYIPPFYSRRGIDIVNAWNRSRGAGASVGLTDTGISRYQEHLLSRFADSLSAGRWKAHFGVGVLDWAETTCAHGTRMAGVIAAPMNGANIVGVAWKSDLVSVHHADGTYNVSNSYASEAIRIAAITNRTISPRRTVTMAWQALGTNLIADQIRAQYANGALFIGAAGTVDYFGVAFPADMVEVVAVSAVDPDDYSEIAGLNYGDQVELSFPRGQWSLGKYTNQSASLGGSSGAAAAVSGIAALVWAQFPHETNINIRQRLREAAHYYPNHNRVVGYGVPNAMKGVGGLTGANISNCDDAPDCTHLYKLSSCTAKSFTIYGHGGDGPFTYQWNNGSKGPSTTLTLCPLPGEIASYSLIATIRDADEHGVTSYTRSLKIDVISSNPDDACPTCPK